MKPISLLILAMLFLFPGSCNLPDSADDNEIIVTEKTARLIDAENNFGFELYQNIFTSDHGFTAEREPGAGNDL